MAGPTDVKAAFVRDSVLTVIDGRGHVWTYEPSITEDANGNAIVAPADFAFAEPSDNAIMTIDSTSAVWLFNLNTGTWSKGPSLDARPPDADKDPYNPWKRGSNVTMAAPAEEPDEPLPAAKSDEPLPTSKKRSKE